MVKSPAQAKELVRLLDEDQKEWRDFAKAEHKAKLADDKAALRSGVRRRAERMLQILDEVSEPSLSNIGAEASRAISILALHDSLDTLRRVYEAFVACYERDKDDTYHQAIPSMADWLLVLERKPQRFGTIWLMDDKKEPFLYPVEGFDQVNERRAKYGVGPLRWPKSLAIPEAKQPWLNRPLTDLIMREPTEKEYKNLTQDYLN